MNAPANTSANAPADAPAMTAPESIYALPAELRQALLNYLYSRPYGEVAQGVQALMALEPVVNTSTLPPLYAVGSSKTA